MRFAMETLGNATVQLFHAGRPLLATDPWLTGTAYFGSWALERPPGARQIENVRRSPYVWFSHGHPDHLHPPSLDLLSRDSEILLPDHYHPEIGQYLAGLGFRTRILGWRRWTPLADGVEVLCLDNENMDAILVARLGETLVINKNDSPFCGEESFLRRLVRAHRRSYLLSLCGFDGDMLNQHDAAMRPLYGPPQERKPGTVWALCRICDDLGVQHYCCSSFQHHYARADTVWANPYRITWPDMQRYWCARDTRLIPPFVTIDLETGAVAPVPPETAPAPIVPLPADDWNEPMSAADWAALEAFVRRFRLLRRWMDFVGFTVAGEARRFALRATPAWRRSRGVQFHVPRRPLMEVVASGYFDDLLIANFMRTQLFEMQLYPHFTPLIAKIGGNAKVYTAADYRRFRWHYFRRAPAAYLRYRWQLAMLHRVMPAGRVIGKRLRVFPILKRARALVVGSPRPL